MANDTETLAAICDLLQIGSAARAPHIILENVRNAVRRSQCLSGIEHRFFTFQTPPDPDEGDDEPGEECLLNWGDDPLEYAEKFLDALPRVAAAHGVEGGSDAGH